MAFLSQSQYQQLLATRQRQKKIVLVTGVFDLLHSEHVRFLRAAKAVGNVLVVGIESDARVRQIKGEGRPVQTATLRAAAIEQLQVAEVIFILPDEFSRPADHEALIAEIQPAVLAVSAHTAHQDKKRALVEKYGGELRVVLEHNPAVSTTIALNQKPT